MGTAIVLAPNALERSPAARLKPGSSGSRNSPRGFTDPGGLLGPTFRQEDLTVRKLTTRLVLAVTVLATLVLAGLATISLVQAAHGAGR